MSVAIIQGTTGGLGLVLTRHILSNTSLKVYALTHKQSSQELIDKLGGKSDRLTILDGVNLKEEGSLQSAAETVKGREGSASVRLVACLAGIVRTDKHCSHSWRLETTWTDGFVIAKTGEIASSDRPSDGLRQLRNQHPRSFTHLQTLCPPHPIKERVQRSPGKMVRIERSGEGSGRE